jgi:hypothetical protein
MSSYEYHEFRAVDRPLTPAEQREVAKLSSRAEVSAHHATFVYNYSSFRGDPNELLTTVFDAMFFISSYGDMQLVFRLPRSLFDLSRAEPYLVEEGGVTTSGIQLRAFGDQLLLSVGLEEMELGWVEGEGWLEPMLPLREDLLAGDDRPLYLFWLAAFENGLVDLDEVEEERQEPPVPPGMGELGQAHRAFARSFEISDGLLTAAAAKSPQRVEAKEDHLARAIEAIDEITCRELLQRVGRGEHVEVRRELQAAARALLGESATGSSCRTLDELARTAQNKGEELAQRAHEAHLDEIETQKETLWKEVESRLAARAPRYLEPIKLLGQLHELARERGGLEAFRTRLEKFDQYGKSKAFMQRLTEAGIIET